MTEDQDFQVVFAGKITEADLVKFVLEEVGIKAWLENEQVGTTIPVGSMQEVRVVVTAGDTERARAEIERSRKDETTEDS